VFFDDGGHVNVATTAAATIGNVNIVSNDMQQNVNGQNIIPNPIVVSAAGSGGGISNLTVQANKIGTLNSAKTGCNGCTAGIRLVADGTGAAGNTPTLGNMLIDSNVIRQTTGNGIQLLVRNGSAKACGTVTNNDVQDMADPANSIANAIQLNSGAGGDTTKVSINFHHNTVDKTWTNTIPNPVAIRVINQTNCTFILPGLADTSSTGVNNYLSCTGSYDSANCAATKVINTGTNGVASNLLNSPFSNIGSCPLLLAPNGDLSLFNFLRPLPAFDLGHFSNYGAGDAVALNYPSAATTSLNQQQLESIVAAAIEHWLATGLTPQQLAVLRGIKFDIADLNGSYLGESDGNRILVDRNAQGRGWFVDPNPLSDASFAHAVSATRRYTDPLSAPAGHVDLLTAIEHEMGHCLRLPDTYAAQDRDSLMYGYLTVGERRLPSHALLASIKSDTQVGAHFLQLSEPTAKPEIKHVYHDRVNKDVSWLMTEAEATAFQSAQMKTPTSVKSIAPPKDGTLAPQVANFPLSIGTLKPGKSVTITFSVTVNNPVPQGTTSVSNQGTVSGMDGANPFSVLTDDPDVAGTTNPTVTQLLAPPDIFIRDARVAEPASGSRNMIFTVVLSTASAQTVSVNFTTADDTGGANPATAGTDYTPTSGTVAFMPNQRVKTISVPVLADAASPEPNETFLVNLSNPTNGNISDGQAVGTITQGNTPGTVLISELRTSGPGTTGTGDLNDDFVEIYNNSDSPLTVQATDASTGWALVSGNNGCTGDPAIVGVIPNGTVIPARGHYLFVGSGYSLASYAAGNQTLTANLNSDTNVGLFSTADLASLSSINRLDGVGFELNTSDLCDLLREGSTMAGATGSTAQYSFVRRLNSGTPQDTNDNTADFVVVSTTPVAVGNNATPTLGAPGPENLASPIQRNATIKATLIDPQQASTNPPNRVRDFTPVTNGASGTLNIRRKFTNSTGAAVTRLRFRIVDITTATAPAGQADLRALTSTTATVTITGGGSVTVQGLTLETPPTQANGGGMNSTVVAGTVTVGTPLANGASINVQFQLGVQQAGSFRFFINVEALP
jgi:hypothetical protein